MRLILLSLPEVLGIEGANILKILFSLIISILFLQSGIDKLLNYKGELGFYQKHFAKSFLKSTVGLLLPILTLTELAAGALSALGIFVLLGTQSGELATWGMFIAALAIIQLFFGQRIAKDYAGASALVPYFLLTMAGLYTYLFW